MGPQIPKLGDLLQASTSAKAEFVDIDLASQIAKAKAWPLSWFQQAFEPLPQADSSIGSVLRIEGLKISIRAGVRVLFVVTLNFAHKAYVMLHLGHA